jgi:c-di-AMP phosphodiesterase-like protein
MQKKEFKETTGFPMFIIVLFFVQFAFFIIYTINNKEDKSLIYFSIGILFLGILMLLTRLKIRITKNEIEYKMTPFIYKKILMKDINEIKIIKISALSDFSGWGIRYSKKYGWGYITNSDYGLFIEKNNGKKLTFSIKNNSELNEYLNDHNKSVA